jgi:hypothetical protein
MCSDRPKVLAPDDDRPATKEEEEAWQEFCMLMGDLIEKCEETKRELEKLSEALTDNEIED